MKSQPLKWKPPKKWPFWRPFSDIILVGLRDYQDQKADVIMKYNSDEARRLKNMGHLPDSVNVSRLFLDCSLTTLY